MAGSDSEEAGLDGKMKYVTSKTFLVILRCSAYSVGLQVNLFVIVCHFILLSHPAAVIWHPFVAVCLKPQQFVDQPSCVRFGIPQWSFLLHFMMLCLVIIVPGLAFLSGASFRERHSRSASIPPPGSPPASLCNHFTSP